MNIRKYFFGTRIQIFRNSCFLGAIAICAVSLIVNFEFFSAAGLGAWFLIGLGYGSVLTEALQSRKVNNVESARS